MAGPDATDQHRHGEASASGPAGALGHGQATEPEERAQAQLLQRRFAFLAEAGKVLAETLDREAALRRVTRLAVPLLADWCSVDVVDDDGSLRGIGGSHVDAEKEPLLQQLQRHVPPDPAGRQPVSAALRSRRTAFYPHVTEDMLRATSRDAEHLRLRLALGFSSVLVVPLVARGHLLGAMTFARGPAARRYEALDLELAEEVALRVALALDNARLYQEAQAQAEAQTMLNASLREMAEARDRALSEAQAALRLREQFLAAAAHELRTPLTSLRGYAQLLHRHYAAGRTPEPQRVERALRLIDLQSERLTRLIRQLLDLSHVETHDLALEREAVEITALAGRVLADAQAMIEATAPAGGGGQRKFRLEAPAPVVAQLDRLRLEQVLSCLVENAIRYSPHETVVELSVQQPDAAHVAIAVRDHGVGVPSAEREHLFEPFFQSPLRAAAGGMGLGLYVSREIVHLHGGTISAEFPPDGGTRFVITLPLEPAG